MFKRKFRKCFFIKIRFKNYLENNNDFRLINDNCVEREINFILNGDIHGNKIFKSDLKFSVTYREFERHIR